MYCLMKKITLLSIAVLSLLAAASCMKEVGPASVRTTISASLASCKTALGDKDGASWPNYWKADDKISVNGVTSEPLDAAFDQQATAEFTFEEALTAPFYAAYPAAALSNYETGSATLLFTPVQEYVEGSYDPMAFVMGGKSDDAGLVVLSPCVSVFHLSLTGEASITKVRLTGADDAALSGTFSTDFESFTPVTVYDCVEMVTNAPVKLPAEFFICVPAGLSGTVKVEAFDSDGGFMSKNATLQSPLAAGKMYSPAALAYAPSYDITISATGITSSTAVICWDNAPEAAYTIKVFSDEACSELVNSYAVPAGDGCWSGVAPRFCISGLDAGTTYYVKVVNVGQSAESNVLPVTTSDFEIVQVSSEPAGEGDVILAEDFSELCWDCDMIAMGAGWFPTADVQQYSFSTVDVDSYHAAETSSEKQLSSQTGPLASSRLMHWAQGAERNMYIHPGYIKLVGSSKVTHLVTPALDNIPEGKVATLEVEVTASRYYSESSSTWATEKAIVAVQPAGAYNELLSNGVNTLDLSSNIANITLPAESAWKTFKVTLNGVAKGDRLAFGAHNDIKKNEARMNISDMKVTIKNLYDEGGLTASVKSVSSSTAAFTWTHAGSASEDVSKPYRIALFSDSACNDLVVSHEIEANDGCWNKKIPCFAFGGLQPSTTYWFVVEDLDSNVLSEPVSATTEDFTVVDATTVTDAAVGDVILAEDFSEVAWGSDEVGAAAGFVPDHKGLVIPGGEKPEGSFRVYNTASERIFGAGIDLEDSRISHGWGFFGNSSVYIHNGYFRASAKGSSGKAARTHLVTPALSGIPAGKLATIEVSVTATKYDPIQIAVFAEKGLTMNPTTDLSSASYKKYTGASLSEGYDLGITTTREWVTKSVTISDVEPDCHLVIGSLENYTDPSDGQNKNRFFINDVVVTITALKDDPVFKITDDATFLAFVSSVAAGNKELAARVTTDLTLDAATVEAFETIEDYAAIFDGNGKTISGLTKPLFNDLKGTAKDLTLNSTLNITADQLDLGILANVLSGTADGCTSQGSVTFNVAGGVTGEHHIAGLIGMANEGATITDCTNEATVTNETAYASGNTNELMVGGVLGTFWGVDFSISGCENSGTVTNNGAWNKDVSIGGVIGQAGNSSDKSCTMTVSDCTNSGAVVNNGANDGAANCVGGVIGWIRFGTYTDNTNTGAVSNTGNAKQNRVGGLIGYLDKGATLEDNSNSGEVSNTGAATDNNYVGGLLGRMQTANTFKTNANDGAIYNSGDAKNYVCIGGIVSYLEKDNLIDEAGDNAKYKLTNSGDIINAGSAKNICIGGLFGRNYSGYFNMRGSSTVYSSNSGNITDTSGPAKSNGGDLSIGGIAGYTSTGIKTQYARNSGDIYVTGDKGSTSVNVGGIGGWISNASFNFNNCRNTGDVTIDCTTTKSIWAAGIVGCPKPNSTVHYYWRSNATIDTHAATVGGDNYTAGLMGTTEGDSSNTFTMYGHRLAGTVWGSTTTTGLFCCTKSDACSFSFQGGTSNPNRIAPGTVRKDNVNENTVNDISDVTIGILAGGAGSTYDITSAIADGHLVVEAW